MTHAFIGLMVLYRLTEEEARATNIRREDARQNLAKMREERPGFQAHVGNMVEEGDPVAMVITHVGDPFRNGIYNDPGVNGQAFLDGNDSLWVTNVFEGAAPGSWKAITDG